MKPFMIFSIDKKDDKEVRDLLEATLEYCGFKFNRCQGKFNDEIENSWICRTDALPMIWQFLIDQDSIMTVSSCNKQYVSLVPLHKGVAQWDDEKPCGSMKAITAKEAELESEWTYHESLGVYYAAKDENPDRIPPPNGWPSDGRAERISALIRLAAAGDSASLIEFVKSEYGV